MFVDGKPSQEVVSSNGYDTFYDERHAWGNATTAMGLAGLASKSSASSLDGQPIGTVLSQNKGPDDAGTRECIGRFLWQNSVQKKLPSRGIMV